MSIRSSYYALTMPDGRRWQIPVAYIVERHADVHRFDYELDVTRSREEGSWPLLESDPETLVSWAREHLTWDDVKTWAQPIIPAESFESYNEGLQTAEILISSDETIYHTSPAVE